MSTLSITQQFGAQAGETLRRSLPGVRVVDGAAGPGGWTQDTEVLLAAPTKAWRGTTRPEGWPGKTRWIQLPGTGVDSYPEWLFEVPCVTSAPGLHALPIAEFVIASLLAFEKRFPQSWVQSAENWKPRSMGTLRGRTLALAGVGAIGGAVARHALGFGMRVIGLRQTAVSPMEGVAVVTDAKQLAPEADHLVLCMPSTPQTRHVVDDAFLAACRPGLHIVNVARGELIDHDALLRALDAGIVARASLDVTSPEPLPPGHPLYAHPKVHLSPHVAWNAPGAVDRLLAFFIGQLEVFTSGGAPRFPVAP